MSKGGVDGYVRQRIRDLLAEHPYAHGESEALYDLRVATREVYRDIHYEKLGVLFGHSTVSSAFEALRQVLAGDPEPRSTQLAAALGEEIIYQLALEDPELVAEEERRQRLFREGLDHSTHFMRWDEFADVCDKCATPFERMYFVGVSVYGAEEVVQLAGRGTDVGPETWITYRWRVDGEATSGGQLMIRLDEWFRPLTEEEATFLRDRFPGAELLFYTAENFPNAPAAV